MIIILKARGTNILATTLIISDDLNFAHEKYYSKHFGSDFLSLEFIFRAHGNNIMANILDRTIDDEFHPEILYLYSHI